VNRHQRRAEARALRSDNETAARVLAVILAAELGADHDLARRCRMLARAFTALGKGRLMADIGKLPDDVRERIDNGMAASAAILDATTAKIRAATAAITGAPEPTTIGGDHV
jgi:hypothetical protein